MQADDPDPCHLASSVESVANHTFASPEPLSLQPEGPALRAQPGGTALRVQRSALRSKASALRSLHRPQPAKWAPKPMRSAQSSMVFETGEVPLEPPCPASFSTWMRIGPLPGAAADCIAAVYL